MPRPNALVAHMREIRKLVPKEKCVRTREQCQKANLASQAARRRLKVLREREEAAVAASR